MKINPENLQVWLAKVNFAEHGDELERKFYNLLGVDFPNLEAFWRTFVVPLTTRLLDYPKATKPSISFRAQVDESLQRICSANYSVFVHLALAKKELTAWNDEQSLELVYLRLSSSFDVFESLCFAFAKLLHQCRGIEMAGLEKFDQTRITEIATDFAKKRYSKLFERFAANGRTVVIPLHNLDGVLTQYFSGTEDFTKYKSHRDNVRKMRNALVHDLRLGQIADENGRLFIPRPAVVDRYRSWSEILSASKSLERVEADFSDPITQAGSDLAETLKLLNSLYLKLLNDFEGEFFSRERLRLRECFHIEFSAASEEQAGAARSGETNLGIDITRNFGRSLTGQLSASDFSPVGSSDDVAAASGVAPMPKKKTNHPSVFLSGTAPIIPPLDE